MRKTIQSTNDTVQIQTKLQMNNGVQVERIYVGKYRYSKSDHLGSGFSGNVYKATLISDQKQRFAIKVIDLNKFNGEEFQLLNGEVHIIRSLNHPNIIKCFDVYRNAQHYYLVTEYCPHGDLQGLITQQKQICEDVAIRIMEQVIDAYRYLLSQKVLHRDLKPANIMRFGNMWKIGDFGFSRHCSQEFVLEQINLGTPLYMSLQCLELNKYSYKSDLFALGVIFFEMLVGKTPWRGNNKRSLIKMMKECKQVPLPDTLECSEVTNFLKRTLAIDYYDRMSRDEFNKISFSNIDLNKIIQKRNRSRVSCKRTVSLSVQKSHRLTPSKQFKTSTLNTFNSQNKLTYTHKSIKKLKSLDTQNIPQNTNQIKSKAYPNNLNNFALIRIFHENAQIIRNQIQLCVLLGAMVQNIQHLHLQIPSETYLISILISFIVKDLTMIMNTKLNILKLSNWDTFRKSSIFRQCQQEIQNNLKKYEFWEIDFNRQIDKSTARLIQQDFPEFLNDITINYKFYSKFCDKIKEIIRSDILVVAQYIDEESKRGFNNGLSQLVQIIKIIQYRSSKANEKKGVGLILKPEVIGNYSRPSNRLMIDYRTLSLQDNLAILISRIELPN